MVAGSNPAGGSTNKYHILSVIVRWWWVSRIYTRTGDKGDTYCAALKSRVPKDHPLIEFVGTLDEAISSLGMAAAFCQDSHGDIADLLTGFQRLLFNVGFLLSGHSNLTPQTVEELESIVDKYMEGLDLKGFILPGGSPCSSAIHLARSVARRAERRLASVIHNGGYGLSEDKLNLALKILNRLSDALFAIAFWVQSKEGRVEYL